MLHSRLAGVRQRAACTRAQQACCTSVSTAAPAFIQRSSLRAAPSKLSHVRDLTVAFEPKRTYGLLCEERELHMPWLRILQQLLAACGSLQRLHLHFHPPRYLDNSVESAWER